MNVTGSCTWNNPNKYFYGVSVLLVENVLDSITSNDGLSIANSVASMIIRVLG